MHSSTISFHIAAKQLTIDIVFGLHCSHTDFTVLSQALEQHMGQPSQEWVLPLWES